MSDNIFDNGKDPEKAVDEAELQEYGVWVKSGEPEDTEEAPLSFEEGEELDESFSSDNEDYYLTDEEEKLLSNLEEDSLPDFDDLESSFEEGPERDIEEETFADDSFEDDITEEPTLNNSSNVHNGEEKTLLLKIEEELASLRQEIRDLKKELAAKNLTAAPVASVTEENVSEQKSGFFDQDTDEETIALTGDELDNILGSEYPAEDASIHDIEVDHLIMDEDEEDKPVVEPVDTVPEDEYINEEDLIKDTDIEKSIETEIDQLTESDPGITMLSESDDSETIASAETGEEEEISAETLEIHIPEGEEDEDSVLSLDLSGEETEIAEDSLSLPEEENLTDEEDISPEPQEDELTIEESFDEDIVTIDDISADEMEKPEPGSPEIMEMVDDMNEVSDSLEVPQEPEENIPSGENEEGMDFEEISEDEFTEIDLDDIGFSSDEEVEESPETLTEEEVPAVSFEEEETAEDEGLDYDEGEEIDIDLDSSGDSSLELEVEHPSEDGEGMEDIDLSDFGLSEDEEAESGGEEEEIDLSEFGIEEVDETELETKAAGEEESVSAEGLPGMEESGLEEEIELTGADNEEVKSDIPEEEPEIDLNLEDIPDESDNTVDEFTIEEIEEPEEESDLSLDLDIEDEVMTPAETDELELSEETEPAAGDVPDLMLEEEPEEPEAEDDEIEEINLDLEEETESIPETFDETEEEIELEPPEEKDTEEEIELALDDEEIKLEEPELDANELSDFEEEPEPEVYENEEILLETPEEREEPLEIEPEDESLADIDDHEEDIVMDEPLTLDDHDKIKEIEETIQSMKDYHLTELPYDVQKELKEVLIYMDQLLESLPQEKIKEFARSEHFEVYKKIFEELGIDR